MRSAGTGSTSARARHRCSNRTARVATSSLPESSRANGANWRKHRIDAVAPLRRPAAPIVLGEDGTDQPAETLGLLIVQIAGQAERMAASIDELLQRIRALRGIADDGDAGARSNLG